MDFPGNNALPTHINSFSRWMGSATMRILNISGPANVAWGTANTAIFLPLFLPWSYPVRRIFWYNGSAAGGNSDFGIYSTGGGKIWSTGSTANSGNSVPQYVAPSPDLLLPPGGYFLAYTQDNTTANRIFVAAHTNDQGRLLGAYQMASAFPLPATATFAAYAGVGWPMIGLTNTASGF